MIFFYYFSSIFFLIYLSHPPRYALNVPGCLGNFINIWHKVLIVSPVKCGWKFYFYTNTHCNLNTNHGCYQCCFCCSSGWNIFWFVIHNKRNPFDLVNNFNGTAMTSEFQWISAVKCYLLSRTQERIEKIIFSYFDRFSF